MTKINLNSQEAAQSLGISARTLWQLTKDRKVPHLRLGGRVTYPQETLTNWANQQAKMALREGENN